MVLHTLNSSPTNGSAFDDCLKFISAPAALLLIEDGVYGASQAQAGLLDALDEAIECYVLQVDLEARGLNQMINPRFKPISDQQFVELSLRCQNIQSWY